MFRMPAYDPVVIAVMGCGILLAAALAFPFWLMHLQECGSMRRCRANSIAASPAMELALIKRSPLGGVSRDDTWQAALMNKRSA